MNEINIRRRKQMRKMLIVLIAVIMVLGIPLTVSAGTIKTIGVSDTEVVISEGDDVELETNAWIFVYSLYKDGKLIESGSNTQQKVSEIPSELYFANLEPGNYTLFYTTCNFKIESVRVFNGVEFVYQNRYSPSTSKTNSYQSNIYVESSKIESPIITKFGNKVIINAPTEGSAIYYTTDGSTPTRSNGIRVNGTSVTIDTFSGHLKAIAVKDGYVDSDMARLTLFTAAKERNVSFEVKGVLGGRNVTFNSPIQGAQIYYSSTTSTLTTSDKCVNAGDTVLFENFYGTIYARTYYNGEWGNVCRLILKIPVVNTPTISVDSNGYATIRTTTPSSYIYYTTDGSTPSITNGKKVLSPYVRVYVGKDKTVRAIAVRSCFTNSEVATYMR